MISIPLESKKALAWEIDVNGWQPGRLISNCQKLQFICGGRHQQTDVMPPPSPVTALEIEDDDDDDGNHLLPYQIAVFFSTMTNHSGISEFESPFVRFFELFC